MDQRPMTTGANLGESAGGKKPQPPLTIAAMASRSPAIKKMLEPIRNRKSWLNDRKVRRLYLQASSQQWFAPTALPYDTPLEMEDEKRRILIKFNRIFYTMEKMGLVTIMNMMPKAVRKLKSEEASFYLSAQCYDEGRHVFAVEEYLKALGAPPVYDRKLHVFSQAASMGFYRVENWLFSTLFSENFASAYLRRYKAANPDPVGAEMCRLLLVDESRHIHFLHMVLPDILDRLGMFGRTYVKGAQYFIMQFTNILASQMDKEGDAVGISRRDMLEEVFENVERAYEGFGVSRDYLWFPKIRPAH